MVDKIKSFTKQGSDQIKMKNFNMKNFSMKDFNGELRYGELQNEELKYEEPLWVIFKKCEHLKY